MEISVSLRLNKPLNGFKIDLIVWKCEMYCEATQQEPGLK